MLVCSAAVQELQGAPAVVERLCGGGAQPARFARLRRLWADAGYLSATLLAWTQRTFGLTLTIVERPRGERGFRPLPRRWVVERTFAWLGRYRRLSKDYEQNVASSEAYCYLAMIHLMVRRLAP